MKGKLYLCAVKDVYSNRIVGYSIDSRMKSRLAVTALNSAVARRGDVAGCILHTDRGSQFRSRKFVRALSRHDMVGSMGRVGACGDNAAMESFFSLLQKNVLDRRSWATREELRIAIVTWIERTYHRRRTAGRPRPIDPHRVRDHHDHTGHSGRLTQPVTYRCSSPYWWSTAVNLAWLRTHCPRTSLVRSTVASLISAATCAWWASTRPGLHDGRRVHVDPDADLGTLGGTLERLPQGVELR